jgi:hypothetical protein
LHPSEYNPERKSIESKFEARSNETLSWVATEITEKTTENGSVKVVQIGKRLNPFIYSGKMSPSKDYMQRMRGV